MDPILNPISPAPLVSEHDRRFRCPNCGGPLSLAHDILSCAPCGHTFPVCDGIVDLRWHRRDYYFNPVPRPEMATLVSNASSVPWDETVRGFLRFVKNPSDWVDNVAVNGRYAWKLMLALPEQGRFLDFGCGLGNLTQSVSPHVAETVALDLTWERLQFARERFAKLDYGDRITLVAGGDGLHLPFPDAHFDCIALSGVLEWIADDTDFEALDGGRWHKGFAMIASFFGSRNPRRTQLRFLRELGRILKPGGQLFVGIENRLGYEYFIGRPDHHSGLPLGSLLPRFIANLYSIARNHRPYRTYTHSFRGMKRLFAEAGMPKQELYGLTPGYSHLAEIVPAWTRQPFWDPHPPNTLAERVRRSRYFVPAFGMIAQTQASTEEPMIARVLSRIGEQAALGGLAIRECRITGKEKVVLKVDTKTRAHATTRSIVVKIPCDASSAAGETRNAEVLALLAGRSVTEPMVPVPIGRDTTQGLEWFAESFAPGVALTHADAPPSRKRLATDVCNMVRQFSRNCAARVAVDEQHPLYLRLAVRAPVKLREAGADERSCATIAECARDILRGAVWQLGLVHGDLSASNLFVHQERIGAVIDWECSENEGLPALDMLAYFESRQRMEEPGTSFTDNFVRLARRAWPSNEEISALYKLYAEFDVDPSQHHGLCLLGWLSHLDRQLDTSIRFDPNYAQRAIALAAPLLTESQSGP